MQGQFQAPPISKTNKIIIIALVVIFILNQALKGQIGHYFALSYSGFSSGLIYQLVTYPLVEGSFMGLIFEGLLLWFIGSELESKWGQKFYLQFLAISVISVAPVYLLLSIFTSSSAPLMGITGFNYALLVAYAIIYAERQLTFMLIFPMKAKYFCLLLAGIQLYMGIFSQSGAISLSHLSAMLFGFFVLQFERMKGRGVRMGDVKNKMHKKRMKSKLRIVTDDEVAPKDKANPDDPKFWQ